MKKLCLTLLLLLIALPCSAQTWITANQVTLAWDAVAKIATTDTIKYQVYTKFEVTTATPQKVGSEITATQQAVSFSTEGRYYLCVGAIRYPAGETVGILSDRLACTDVAADTAGGTSFGVVYYIAPTSAKMLRTQ